MVDAASRLETMREMFLAAGGLNSWCLTPELQLLYSNSESQQFFWNLFLASPCAAQCKAHFQAHDTPALLEDQMGFAWIAAGQFEEEKLTAVHLVGPMFTVEANESYLRGLCLKMRLSDTLVEELLKQLKLVPTVVLNVAVNYALMVYYCVTGKQVAAKDVAYLNAGIPEEQESQWENPSLHNTWEAERLMFRMIQEGSLENMVELAPQFSGGQVGKMCPDDPLRQAKDEVICLAVLCSRAAILGGVSPEGGYNMADYYIQRAEAAQTVSAAQSCGTELLQTAVARVRRCRANSRYTSPISACMEYIETHIQEKISLDAMAHEIGYASYYLSSKFQKETGISITDYVKQRKIDLAKEMLHNHSLSATDVSERLSFSSPSYFGAVFRKYTGMTPNEYQKKTYKE